MTTVLNSILMFMMPLFDVASVNATMEAIRQEVLNISNTLVPIASALACVFVAIELVKISYDLVSDEQSGGRGSLKASQILIPIGIIICINAYRPIIQIVDYVFDSIADVAMDEELYKDATAKYAASCMLEYTLKDGSKIIDLMQKKDVQQAEGTLFQTTNRAIAKAMLEEAGVTEYRNIYLSNLTERVREYQNLKASKYFQEVNPNLDEIIDQGWDPGFKGIVDYFSAILYPLMICIANIILCVMAIFGPFVLAFSVFTPWRSAPIQFLGKYATISLWKATGAIIVWVTSISKIAIMEPGLNQMTNLYNSLLAGKPDAELLRTHIASTGGGFLITIASCLALLAIGEITDTAINIVSVGLTGMTDNVGRIAGAPASAVSKGTSAAGKAMGKMMK